MQTQEKLPVYGVGPFLIAPLIIISLLGLIFSVYDVIPVYRIDNPLIFMLSIILIVIGAIFWLSAVSKSKIEENVNQNQLVTTGIYAIVRHPIYAAFLYISTALVLLSSNLYLFILPVFFWLFLTVAMKSTEEKLVKEKFGSYYSCLGKKIKRVVPLLRI